MKLKLFTLSLVALAFSFSAHAQPKDTGIEEFDNFKDSAYDLKAKTGDIKQTVTDIDTEVKNLVNKEDQTNLSKLDDYVANLKKSAKAVSELTTKATELTTTGAELVKKAPSAKPKMKSIAAVKNTKSSVEQVDKAKEDLTTSKTMIDDNLKIIKELKAKE